MVNGIEMIGKELLPDDRISIVVLSDQANEMLRNVTPKKLRAGIAKLRDYRPTGTVDYQTGLENL